MGSLTLWEELADDLLPSSLSDKAGDEVVFDFVKNWQSGKVSFDTLEWRSHLQSGIVTQSHEEDISAKIETLSILVSSAGNMCPFSRLEAALVPLKLYGIMIFILVGYTLARTVTFFEKRLIE